MEEDQSAVLVAEGAIKSIKLSLSTEAEICTYSINDCPVTHPSQLGNPFLGLPLESGKCESCGASENGKCEGHFGYIELPVPIYHPCHVSELRQLLTLVCLKCRRMKKAKGKQSNGKENVSVTACHYADCRALPALSVKETKTADGAFRLELKAPPKKHMTERSWNFLDQYGFHYGGASHNRILLPEEALNILKKIPDETKKKLAARGYIAQSGYVMKYLPVPPNCLYIPEFTDGQSIMSYDISISLLKKILQKIEQIKKSRAGPPNFESHDVESSDLQLSIGQYIQLRGTTKGPQDAKRYAISTDSSHLSTKQWLDKMRTLFISKGEDDATDFPSDITPGEPVGVLAATAISNPAYKAVLDASQSNNTSWELMKEILQTKVNYKNDTKDRKVILFLNDCSCPKKFCKEKAAIAVQGCLKKVTLEDCATDMCIEYQKQTSLDGISEATPAFVGHIHLQKAHLETINISTEDILHKCQEVSVKHGMKKGHLAHLFKKITFSTCDCSFTQKPIDGKVPCLQFSFSEDIPMLSESVEKAVNVLADSMCGVLLDTIIKGDPRIQEAKITWVGSDATSWVKHTKKASKGEPAVEIVVEKGEALQNGDAWRIAMDACIPVMNLIDTRRSIPYGIQQVRKLLGIACSFDQVVQRLSTTMKTVAKGILKDHLVLVANSMTCTGNLNGFNNAGYKATFRSLKVQVPFTESTLFTPMKCFEKAAEKCHSDSLGCVVSSCSWGKHAALGTGSSFEVLWNENQLKSNKEYGDGLYDFLALVRTDQEKARYTFLDDVDYLVEDNACLSPELKTATFEDCLEEQVTEKGGSWDNDRTANANWDQNASAGNDSENWGGWSNATAAADTGAAKSADQGIASWNVPVTVENDSADWGGWGTEKVKDKKTVPEEPAGLDTWADQSAKKDTDAHNGSWGSVAAKTRTCTAEDVPWGRTQTSSAEHMDAQNDSWENVAAKAASPSDNAWNAAPVSQGNENSEAKEPDAWDGWGSAQAKDSSADDLNKSDASNNSKGWKSDGWAAKESRRDQRDNLGRPPMRPVERPPRPRFELPADAKKILHEIEPIVLSVRKIFRESCDGVNLSLEDEKFIKEKILEHHPEKDKKLSSETDHIVVNKHHTFQESRCFYVVSSDGTQTDFSYIKCLDNYVRKSYAEEPAELVSQMYFQRRNRDRAPAEASQPIPAETSQPTPQEAQLETPAPLAGTASQEALASPSATQQETPAATPRETPAATETAPVATPQETLAAAETVNKWAEKLDSDSAWGAGASDDKWA
ncbi:hypothetical protein ACQ4PT_046172 [Festuca glaucescens]